MQAGSKIAMSISDGIAEIRLGTDGHIFLTQALCEELEAALIACAEDAAVRVVILTGANPGVFMRHYSVAEILAISAQLKSQGLKPGDKLPFNAGPIDRCMTLTETMAKPVISAINGECMGGAMELSLACDLRFATQGPYRLGQPETLLGILPGAGGTQRLARVIGYANAMDHALTGVPVTPDEALRLGMVHGVFESALEAARERAKHFCQMPAPVLAHTKRLVRESRFLPLDKGLELERELFLDLILRDESIAMMQAYEAGRYAFALVDAQWRVTIPE